MSKVVIFGCGDIAQVAHYYFSTDSQHEIVAFTVDRSYLPEGGFFCHLPVVAFEELEAHYAPGDHLVFVALSYRKLNQLRAAKTAEAQAKGYALASYVSTKATVLTQEPIGENAFILEDNTIQPFSKIGRNVTLWSGNHIGHHSVVGDHCFIASHVVISGGVKVGEFCFVGVNATVRDHVTIGAGCVIGAGALIMADTEPDGVYAIAGTERAKVPASRLRRL
jgi:sugar O-acyltransferase (sialic acid O-acetyltransferase NeuD family)